MELFLKNDDKDAAVEHTSSTSSTTNSSSSSSRGVDKKGSDKSNNNNGPIRLLAKIFKRLRLQNVCLAANGRLCALALKLNKLLAQQQQGTTTNHPNNIITSPRLVYPELSAKFINNHNW
mmetsp:Transcript_46698/g.113800  ORF Transcript_46698/g.113800 Transcript_46698/m.113800 type:complete len:120 (+) Transcript_46698:475-834(+)